MTVDIIIPKDKLAWHQARAKNITASVAGALLGIYPHKTLYRLWAEKAEILEPENDENDAMRKGRLLEPAAVQMMREDHPDWWFDYRQDNAFYFDRKLRIGATPDCFAMRPDIDGQGIVQIKIVSEDVLRDEWTDDDGEISPPDWIAVQAIVEAKLTQSSFACVFVMAVGRGIKGHMIDIPIHEGIWQTLIAKTREFWKIVKTGVKPTPDWDKDAQTVAAIYRRSRPGEVDMSDNIEFDNTVLAFDSCRKDRKALQDREKVLRAQVLHTMEEKEVALTRTYRVKASTAIDEDGNYSRRITIKERNAV